MLLTIISRDSNYDYTTRRSFTYLYKLKIASNIDHFSFASLIGSAVSSSFVVFSQGRLPFHHSLSSSPFPTTDIPLPLPKAPHIPMENQEQEHTGGCICGAIRFVARGTPFRIAACHCQWCQRASSSAFQVMVFFRKKQVTLKGEENVTHYEERSPVHGRMLPTEFCKICGTRVATFVTTAPSMRLIHAGNFDSRDFINVTDHQFLRRAVWRSFPVNSRLFLDSIQNPDGTLNQPMTRVQNKPIVLQHPESPAPAVHRDKWEGGCMCNSVRYTCSRAPRRLVACHCEFCYRYAGTPFNLLGFYLDSDITLKGDTVQYTHVIPPHGRTVTWSFCGKCGTRVTAVTERLAAEKVVLVYLGSLDGGSPEVNAHQFVKYAPKWIAFPPGKACFEESMAPPAKPLPERGVWARGDWKL